MGTFFPDQEMPPIDRQTAALLLMEVGWFLLAVAQAKKEHPTDTEKMHDRILDYSEERKNMIEEASGVNKDGK